ncbi:MFS transporter [Piscirickettsia litoralis]|uniref:Major facilitator superfamily (MFS) profile domain-containing protein n=1 Tax=Piscirickettsia litoralis TaxID=1891921 RepID=A0ABX3A1R7_9GAMM|nr:MFS transporter [Piscirickettsia litoralis]ODN42435.1 hypothetical protein BGC07_05165 [Piscirickettsia litoralis]
MTTLDKKWKILIGAGLAVLLIGIDFSVVNTALTVIRNDIGASTSQLQWMMSGYGILFAAMLTVLGRIGDIKGRRKALYVGVIGFGLSSLGAGLSGSALFLIIMRMLQGLFSALLYPAAVSVTAAAFSKEQQGRAMGIFGSFFGIGFAVGPVLGSFITGLLSWRWVFFINVPIVIISLLICLPVVAEKKHPDVTHIDWFGVLSLMIFLLGITFFFNEGPRYGWDSHLTIGILVVSLISLVVFCVIEKYAEIPLIPIRLFRNKTFVMGVLIYLATISLSWSVMFIMPIYIQHQLGFSIETAGVLLVTMTVMTMIMPSVGGRLLDKGNKYFVRHVPMLCSIFGLFVYTLLGGSGPVWLLIVGLVLFGSAWGLSNGMTVPLALSGLKNANDHGLVAGVAATLANVFGLPIFTLDILLLRHGEKTSFMHGLHYACYLLLLVSVILWLAMLYVTTRKNKA